MPVDDLKKRISKLINCCEEKKEEIKRLKRTLKMHSFHPMWMTGYIPPTDKQQKNGHWHLIYFPYPHSFRELRMQSGWWHGFVNGQMKLVYTPPIYAHRVIISYLQAIAAKQSM